MIKTWKKYNLFFVYRLERKTSAFLYGLSVVIRQKINRLTIKVNRFKRFNNYLRAFVLNLFSSLRDTKSTC